MICHFVKNRIKAVKAYLLVCLSLVSLSAEISQLVCLKYLLEIRRVLAPLVQQLYVLFRDVSRGHGLFHYVLVVGQGYELHACVLERLLRYGESVGVLCHQAHHLEAGRAQRLYGLKAAASG